MNVDIVLPILGRTKDALPFPIAGLLVVVAAILVFAFVREKGRDAQATEKKVSLSAALRSIAGEKDKSALFILLSLFFWFLGYQGVLPFIGKYSIDVLGTSKGSAALAAGMVGIAYALFAIPSGYIAHRLGRKRAIRASLLALALLLVVLFLFGPLSSALGLAGGARIGLFLAFMFVFGAFWVTVITNSFPMLWQMASWGTVGVYTGLYYTFSQAAAIVAPPITGAIIDLAGYPGIFLFAAACMLMAFLLMGKVRRGEPGEKAEVEA